MNNLFKNKKVMLSLLTLALCMPLASCVDRTSTSTSNSSSNSEVSNTPTQSSTITSSDDLAYLTDLSVRDVVAENGVVAAANPYAAKAGIDVLKAGGNAFEAAVAVSFALGVVEPHASGVGGGGILVGFNAKKGEFVSYNFREFVPAAGTASAFQKASAAMGATDAAYSLEHGVTASGVPTQVAGLLGILEEEASGNVTRQQVMAPAIDYAENGVIITPELGNTIKDNYDTINKECPEETYEVFDDGIEPLKAGDLLVQKNYANTLKKISNQGLDGFYKGDVAQAIIDIQTKNGGFITQADLDYAAAEYPIKATPVRGTYKGYDIVSSTTPSSGGTILVESLNMLEHYSKTNGDLATLGHNSAEYIHTVATAMQLAYGDKRKYIADANFEPVPLSGLLSKEYAAARWDECYDPNTAWLHKSSHAYGGATVNGKKLADPKDYCTEETLVVDNNPLNEETSEHYSTTAFSVCDKDGNIVSITQTINHFFGNSFIPAGTGFFMNGQLSSFSLNTTSAAYVKPFKQPVSHIMPTIILKDGDPWATLGSPGSMRIPSAVLLTTLNLIDFGMNIQEAIEAPRFYSYAVSSNDPVNTKGAINYDDSEGVDRKWIEVEFSSKEAQEGRITEEIVEALEAKNYYVQCHDENDLYFGGVHGITFSAATGKMHGGADTRRDGKALGY